MVLPIGRKRGGFQRPVRLGHFIRAQLMTGDTWAFDLYSMYKEAAQAEPLSGKKKSKRHVISYSGFRAYLYVLRKLGLIEYATDETGMVRSDIPLTKAGRAEAPYLAKTLYLRFVHDDPAWDNPMGYYHGAPAPPVPVTPPTRRPVRAVSNEQYANDLKGQLLDLMDEDKKAQSIKKLETALAGVDEDRVDISGVEVAIQEYREVEREGVSPEEYREGKAAAFEFISETINDLEPAEE